MTYGKLRLGKEGVLEAQAKEGTELCSIKGMA